MAVFLLAAHFLIFKKTHRQKNINTNKKNEKPMKIKPLSDRVIVEPKEAETQTASGLYIPDTAKEKPLQGVVVAVGPGNADVTMEVKVGDTVLYGKYGGQEISHNGTDYLIMKQAEIMAVLEK